MSLTPFEIMRWEDEALPSLAFLVRMLEREGLQPVQSELPPKTHSPEIKFAQPVVRVVVSGKVQYSFPGYGVIELEPGDILEISSDVLHDVIVESHQPALILEANRSV